MGTVCTKNPGSFGFSGNPVIFEFQTDTNEPVNVEIKFDGRSFFTSYYPSLISEGLYRIRMDLSSFLLSDASDSPACSEGEIISSLNGFAKRYEVKIGEDCTFSGTIFRGGISNRDIKLLSSQEMDIFSYRLAYYHGNFLFTTRTDGTEISLRPSELFPFVFIHSGLPLAFKLETGETIETETFPAGTVCTMNIREALNRFPPGTNRIEVHHQDEYAFRFTLQPEAPVVEKYLFRFRNSLGAFEMLEVTGRAVHSPEFSEEVLFETLNDFNFYEQRRNRIEYRNIIEVETGYRTRNEFPFILDMLQSDETYFIYPDGYSFRCNVSADGFNYRERTTEPTSVSLQVKEATKEQYATPPVYADFDRIFDENFDESLN